jgi:cold shock CspA family protein
MFWTLLNPRQVRFTGRLKFYNPENEFGFIIKTKTLEDIFFHLTDMEAVGITATKLLEDKNLFFSFEELEYMGNTPTL